MKMLAILFAICMGACVHTNSPIEASQTSSVPPSWYAENVEFMTRESGVWVTSNAAYVSEQETWTEYGTRWSAGPRNFSMAGELFGRDELGNEQIFWSFSEYWDPARGVAVVEQYGHAAVGIGTVEHQANGDLRLDQIFTQFNGNSRRAGHLTVREGEDAYWTYSFGIATDGEETPQRNYFWIREAIA